MPVQNSNSKTFARPDLVTHLLQILIPTVTFNSQLYQKGQFTFQPCRRRWFESKIFGYYLQKFETGNSGYKFLPLQNEGFQETACPEDRLDGSLLSPCPGVSIY